MEENSRKTMREGVIREELNGVLHVGFELSEDEERSNWVSEFNVSVRDNSTLLVGVGVGVSVSVGECGGVFVGVSVSVSVRVGEGVKSETIIESDEMREGEGEAVR